MTLTFVKPGTLGSTANILLYGPSGCGKSTAASTAPGSILYLNADGPDALRYPRRVVGNDKLAEVTVDGAAAMNEAILALRGKHPFKTVVLDTLSSIYTVLLEEKARGGRPTLPQYGDVGTAIERFCREARDMPINVVLLAEEFGIKDDSTGVIERLPYTGTSNPALGTKLIEMMTIVGYCGRVAPQTADQKPRYMATLVDAPGRRGKDRTDALGAARDLDISEWLAAANASATPTTPEQLEAAA